MGGGSEPAAIRFEYSWKSTRDVVPADASGRKYSVFPPVSLLRNNSSSGYGSEQRCRSTCSITLQTGINRPEEEPEQEEDEEEADEMEAEEPHLVADVLDYPHRGIRRSSESQMWDSHTRIHQLFRKPEEARAPARKWIPDPSPPPPPPPLPLPPPPPASAAPVYHPQVRKFRINSIPESFSSGSGSGGWNVEFNCVFSSNFGILGNRRRRADNRKPEAGRRRRSAPAPSTSTSTAPIQRRKPRAEATGGRKPEATRLTNRRRRRATRWCIRASGTPG